MIYLSNQSQSLSEHFNITSAKGLIIKKRYRNFKYGW